MAWRPSRTAVAERAGCLGRGGGGWSHKVPPVILDEYGLVGLPLGSGRASGLPRGRRSGVNSGVQGASIVERLKGLQVRSRSGVNSGAQVAPIIEQLTD